MGDEAIVHVEGDKVVYRASGIGTYCLKQLIAARMDYSPLPTPERMQQVYDAGSDTEDRIIFQLNRDEGWSIVHRQQEYDWHVTGKVIVRCHVDGVNNETAEPRAVEIKSQSPAEFEKPIDKSGLWDRYLWQVSAIMHATGYPCDLVIVKRDKDGTAERLEWYMVKFEEPPITADQIRRRVLMVEAAAKHDRLPDECDVALYPCPYYYLHGEVQRKNDATLGIPDDDMVALCVQHEEAKLAEKQAKQRKEDIRKAIEAAVDGDKYEIETKYGKVKITFYSGSRKNLDVELFKKEYPEINLDLYQKTSSYRGMRLTIPEGMADES